jgi:hypothetical protein
MRAKRSAQLGLQRSGNKGDTMPVQSYVAGHPSSSHHRCPIIVVQLPSSNCRPRIAIAVAVAILHKQKHRRCQDGSVHRGSSPFSSTDGAHCAQPLLPPTTMTAIRHRPFLPASQHKADCCVKQGQIFGDSLIVSLSLLLRHCRCAAASCLPSCPLCRIPQPAPPPFVALLRPTCSVGCRVARWPPSASQLAPPPLVTPLHLLVVALCHIFWLLGLPSPSHHASTSRCALLVRLVVASCCMAPRPLYPPITVLEMPLSLSSTSSPSIAVAASSPLLSLLPSLSPPSLSLPSLPILKGGRWGDILFFPGFQGLSFGCGGLEASSSHDILLLEGSVASNNDFEVIICTCVDSC